LSEPLRKLIHALKYKGYTGGAQDLVSLVPDTSLPQDFPANTLLIPVPLHPLKHRERGYNQAELIAKAWAKRLSWSLECRGLERRVYTNTQTKLDADHRKANLADAFRAHPSVVSGKTIVLVDDVLTTGATLTACAAVLLSAGAKEVHGLCVAWAGEA
jgi:ComF family protein